jgi:hypothetical protein
MDAISISRVWNPSKVGSQRVGHGLGNNDSNCDSQVWTCLLLVCCCIKWPCGWWAPRLGGADYYMTRRNLSYQEHG